MSPEELIEYALALDAELVEQGEAPFWVGRLPAALQEIAQSQMVPAGEVVSVQ